MTLPESIPLFPLPNVVLFPGLPLPLHVFEPRYRAMVGDALRGSRMIGMVLLRGDWQRDYEGRPPVFGVGTGGQIVHVEELPDGRFNIVLRGIREFTIQEELAGPEAYRRARVDWWPQTDARLDSETRRALLATVRRHLARIGRSLGGSEDLDREVEGGALVNFLSQHLDLDPVERQALLEERSPTGRARRLGDVLEFRLQERVGLGTAVGGQRAH